MLACVLAAGSLTGCGELEDTDVAGTVNGDEITADVANFYARFNQAQYETYYAGYMGDDMWSGEVSEGVSFEDNSKEIIIKTLEDMYLMEDHMEDYAVEITEEDTAAIEEAAETFDGANGLEEKEKVSGTAETVKKMLRLMTIYTKMTNEIGMTADLEISDEEAAQKKMQYVQFSFTTTNDEGDTVQLTDEEKEELKTQAESFAEGAQSASDFAAYAKEQGQEVKETTFDAEEALDIPSELAQAADELPEGGITDVVESASGYYVAQVLSLFDQEATEEEKETIRAERKQQKVDEMLEKWREEADITVNNRVWDKIDFNKISVTMKVDETEPYADEVQTDDVAEEAEAEAE